MLRARSIKHFPADLWDANRGPPSKPSAWERRKCGPVPPKLSAIWDGKLSPSMTPYAVQSSGSKPMAMFKIAIIAALEREVGGFTRYCTRVQRTHEGRNFVFF